MTIVVISRGRAGKTTTQKILPKYVPFIVPESQADDYSKSLSNPIIKIPDNILGLGKVRNWVLDNIKSRMVAIFDDDVSAIHYNGGVKSRSVKGEEAVHVICNMAQMADDYGLHTFVFGMITGMTFSPHEPFSFNRTYSGFVGVIDRKYRFSENKLKVDVDYALQNLLYDRIFFIENRYSLSQQIDRNSGGNSIFRSDELIEKERNILLKKWGKYLAYEECRTNKTAVGRKTIAPKIKVARAQKLDV